MGSLTLLGAFWAGVLSFLSPCVLPLTPIYLARLAGPSVWRVEATQERAGTTRSTTLHAVTFVAGFSLVFIAFGATASALGSVLAAHAALLRQVAGVTLIALGLHVAGIFRLGWLERQRTLSLPLGRQGYGVSFVIGFVFALGWTPCVGPVLGGILVLAAQAATLRAGVLLLAWYALGLGLPFIALALGFQRFAPGLRWLARHSTVIERTTGALLIVLGIVMFRNWLVLVNGWFVLPAAA